MKTMRYLSYLLIFITYSAFGDIELLVEATKHSDYLFVNKNTEAEFNTKSEFLGVIGNKYRVYNHTYYFNNNTRAGHRLVILLSSGELIGMYAINYWASSIHNSCVIFPVSENIGNKICLENGVFPEQVWLDGENPVLFK